MSNFWQQLNKPIFCLAPMEEVTDVAFREMFARYSGTAANEKPKPKKGNGFVMFTEFINVDGLLHPQGFEKLKIDLEYTENQRPIVAQLWGTDPEKFYRAAQLIVSLGFDGIDINMGCPQDKEIGIGACAALIRNPALASEIIEATIKGAGGLPVSVKTRIGYSKPETEIWIGHLLKHNLAAITIHARTKQEKSKVPAQWEEVKKAVEVRDGQQGTGNINHRSQNMEKGTQNTEYTSQNLKHGAQNTEHKTQSTEHASQTTDHRTQNTEHRTLIIGNGDVKSREEGLQKIAETGCDGIMIARGAFGNPWMFKAGGYKPTVKERLEVMLEHAKVFNEKLGAYKSFFIMRKSFKAYCSGFDGAHELRAKLMETKNLPEAEDTVKEFVATKPADFLAEQAPKK